MGWLRALLSPALSSSYISSASRNRSRTGPVDPPSTMIRSTLG